MTVDNRVKYFENREDWRKWLTENFETKSEIWFVFPSKSSGEKGITYNDAVEEALCFEWIDSTIKSWCLVKKYQRYLDDYAKNGLNCRRLKIIVLRRDTKEEDEALIKENRERLEYKRLPCHIFNPHYIPGLSAF